MPALRAATRGCGAGGVRTARCSGTRASPGNGGVAGLATTSVRVGRVAGIRAGTPGEDLEAGNRRAPERPVSIGVPIAQRHVAHEVDRSAVACAEPLGQRDRALVVGADQADHLTQAVLAALELQRRACGFERVTL